MKSTWVFPSKLWSVAGQKVLRELPLPYWVGQRRENLLRLLTIFNEQIAVLDQAAEKAAQESEMARLLLSQPGGGPHHIAGLCAHHGRRFAFPWRQESSQLFGANTSGGQQWRASAVGGYHQARQSLYAHAVVEAAQSVIRCDPGFRKHYAHLCHKKAKGVAKVAAARKLAIRLYWMLRTKTAYPEIVPMESSSRVPLVGKG